MTVQDFITERAKGAAKIAAQTRAKGGLAILTAIHFEAKAPAYAACLGLVNTIPAADRITELKHLETVATQSIQMAPTMVLFQQFTGKQEVYGEVILFLETPNDVERLTQLKSADAVINQHND